MIVSIPRAKHLALGGAMVALLALVASIGLSSPAGANGPPAADGSAAYLGVADCKRCHFKQWKTWKDTKMARSFEILEPGHSAEAKKKFGLDAAKDYTTDEKCLACHTTGLGQPGGYSKTADEETRAARQGVQCEACHGPGGGYSAYMKEHEKEGYVTADALKAGLKMPDRSTCVKCHHGGPDGSPTIAADAKFDFEAECKKDAAIHAHTPKK